MVYDLSCSQKCRFKSPKTTAFLQTRVIYSKIFVSVFFSSSETVSWISRLFFIIIVKNITDTIESLVTYYSIKRQNSTVPSFRLTVRKLSCRHKASKCKFLTKKSDGTLVFYPVSFKWTKQIYIGPPPQRKIMATCLLSRVYGIQPFWRVGNNMAY